MPFCLYICSTSAPLCLAASFCARVLVFLCVCVRVFMVLSARRRGPVYAHRVTLLRKYLLPQLYTMYLYSLFLMYTYCTRIHGIRARARAFVSVLLSPPPSPLSLPCRLRSRGMALCKHACPCPCVLVCPNPPLFLKRGIFFSQCLYNVLCSCVS